MKYDRNTDAPGAAAPSSPSNVVALFRLDRLLRVRSKSTPQAQPDPAPPLTTPPPLPAATSCAAVPSNEVARLDALHRLNLLDTPASEAFDRITRLAAQLFQLPIAAVSLTDSDRQWFKSRVGVAHNAIPRERAPCALVAESASFVVIPDLLLDPCFRDSHLARSGVRFYAGAPLTTNQGHGLGAMCVLGPEPRAISAEEKSALTDLAMMVMSQIELQHALGRIDPLSGLPNRTQFIEDFDDLDKERPAGEARLAVQVHLGTPEQISQAVCAMGAGYLDQMIADAAPWLRQLAGPPVVVYHVASTEFIFIAPPGVDENAYGATLAQRLRQRTLASTARFVSTTAVGVAPFQIGAISSLDLLRTSHSAAQDALHTADGVGIYSPAHDQAYRRRFRLLSEFGAALAAPDQLTLVFQPKIALTDRSCAGAEALLRWSHPVLGQIAPGEFIPIIEATSLARATTMWVLHAALAQQATWRAHGVQTRISVNVSATNLAEIDFAERVQQALAQHGVPADALELEITESAVMANPVLAQATLDKIVAAGVHLAIDDFGTGHSSLAYLQRLRAHVVKIDQSFVRGLPQDERKRALVSTMVTLCHDMGYRVVAEGVETDAELQFLDSIHCDQVQGYFFARPMAPSAFTTWFRAQVWR